MTMDKRALSERDICTKFITPALRKAGWDEMHLRVIARMPDDVAKVLHDVA